MLKRAVDQTDGQICKDTESQAHIASQNCGQRCIKVTIRINVAEKDGKFHNN